MAFQYTQPQLVDYGNVFEPLLRARQQQKADDARKAELLLRQTASDRDQARLDEQVRHTQELEKRQQGIDVAGAIPKIKAALTPGDPSYDPESAMSLARAMGINLQDMGKGAAPTARPVGPTQLEYGPRTTPEIDDQVAARDAQTPPSQPDARADEIMKLAGTRDQERARFAQANDPQAVDRSRADALLNARDSAAYEHRAPTYSGTSPIGPVNIDPNSAIAAREEALRMKREQSQPFTNIPGMEKYQPVLGAMASAGVDPAKIAATAQAFMEQAQKEGERANYELTAAQKQANAEENQRIGWANAGARRMAATGGQDKRAADRQDKEDATIVRDETGSPIGRVPTGRGGAQGFATRDADYARGEQQLNALLADIEQNGGRVMSPEATKRRNTLYHNAVIGVATVSPLGKTNEAMQAEAGSLGASGSYGSDEHGGVMGGVTSVGVGANPEAVRRKIEELRAQRERYRRETLMPLNDRQQTAVSQPEMRQPPRAPTRKSNPIIDARDNQMGKRPSLDDLAKEHGL